MAETREPYLPISCVFYDYLEAAATLQQPVDIVYHIEGAICKTSSTVKTIAIIDRAEYLILGNGLSIRLDHLHTFNGKRLSPDC